MERCSNSGRSFFGSWILLGSYLSVVAYLSALYLLNVLIYSRAALAYNYLYSFASDYAGCMGSLHIVGPYILSLSWFLWRQVKRSSISDLFVSLLIVIYYVPGIVLYTYGNWNVQYLLFYVASILLICIWNEAFHVGRGRIIHDDGEITCKERIPGLLYATSLLIACGVIAVVVYYKGFSLTLDLSSSGRIRHQSLDLETPNVFIRFLNFSARFIPVLLLLCLRNRKVLLSCLLVFAQFVLFSYDGTKYVLFVLIIAVPFMLLKQRITNRSLLLLYLLANLFVGVEILFTSEDHIPLLANYGFRRESFVTNKIGFFYFDFFQSQEYLYYSEGVLKNVLDYPYEVPMPHVIADYAFGHPEMGANAGMCAEGFSQIGWWSLLVYPIAYVTVFKLFDLVFRRFRGRDAYISVFAAIMYAASFIDGALQTVLSTFGLLPLLLMVVILFTYDGTKRCGARS